MIEIEIVYAPNAQEQKSYTLMLLQDSTVQHAIESCPILKDYPEIQLWPFETKAPTHFVGIWSKAANLSDKLSSGDRVEIYRSLSLSAMDARLARHKKHKE